MKISVVGIGHVGSVAAAGLGTAGHDVLGIDIDREKVKSYRSGAVPIYEPGLTDLINAAQAKGRLRFLHTSEVSEPLGEVIVICAGTPTGHTGGADLSQVRSAIKWIKQKQPSGGLIVMKSTVPPGTGARFLDTMLEDSAFGYISNPEFLREGQVVSDWFHPDRIVIGGTENTSIQMVQAIYEGIHAPYVITDITSAEMIKYAANAFLATKISFINEISVLCDQLGASIDDVGNGISLDPRIGSSFLRPGVGYGGSCFPKDVRALDYLALSNGHNFELLRSVIIINNRQRLMPLYALRKRFDRLAGVKVSILGIAFKPNTDDVREAPSVELIHNLVEEGAVVTAYDPIAVEPAKKVLPSSVRVVEDLHCCVHGAQALVLMTEWPEIVEADWGEMARHTEPQCLFLDGRNALDPAKMGASGFEYRGVGRGAHRPP